jgi:hypothetical protein
MAKIVNKDSKVKKKKIKIENTNVIESFVDEYKHVNLNIQNKLFKNIVHRKEYIKQSFKLNYIIWFSLIICAIILSVQSKDSIFYNIKNILCGITYLIISMTFGYYIHNLSHTCSGTLFYKDLLKHFYNRNKDQYSNWNKFVMNYLKYTFDFHSVVHHNSKINKQLIFVIGEILINWLMEGGYIILMAYYFGWNINTNVFWLWGLSYATVHNINYNLYPPECHEEHHKNPNTNFGIDTLDVIFGTKYDYECLENFNHASINVFLITALILYLRYKNILTI